MPPASYISGHSQVRCTQRQAKSLGGSRSKLKSMPNLNSRVHFDPLPPQQLPADEHLPKLSREERKQLWYSREELMDSCIEAKKIVKIINSVNGNFNAIDHSKICVVGLEKFHGKKEKDKYRKLLIKTVLIRQEMNRCLGKQDVECLSQISQLISSSFKEFALWQAAMHKFHTTSSDEGSPASKRQKTEGSHGFHNFELESQKMVASDSTSLSIRSPSNAHPNHSQVRHEIHQLMAGYCS